MLHDHRWQGLLNTDIYTSGKLSKLIKDDLAGQKQRNWKAQMQQQPNIALISPDGKSAFQIIEKNKKISFSSCNNLFTHFVWSLIKGHEMCADLR